MNVFILSFIGAVIILDKYAFGEFGISQPIISGTIFGAISGDISQGIFLGGLFQLVFLGGLPIGRDIPPDAQGAGIAGCGSYFLLKGLNSNGAALFGAVVLGLLAGILGGVLEIYTRRYNEKLYYQFMKTEDCLRVCHLLGILTAFFRGLVLLVPIFLFAKIIRLPQIFPEFARELLLVIAASLGMANGIYLFVRRSTIIYSIIGVLCALALLVF